jgi:hypothetical protein
MDLRYDGDPSPWTGCEQQSEPDLILTSDPVLVRTTTQSPAYMGILSTLLGWAAEDAVSEHERRRNHVIYEWQDNRNPFVDHPEWVATVWPEDIGGQPEPTVTTSATSATPVTPATPATPATPGTPTTPGTPGNPATPALAFRVYLPHASRLEPGVGGGEPTAETPATATRTATTVISPTPTTSPLTPTPSPTLATATATATPSPTDVPTADLYISALQCEGRDEYVRITNAGGAAQQLSGWRIISVVGPQVFDFPSYSLAPGATVSVHSGPDAPPTGGDIFQWSRAYIWNNDGDTAELRDPSGALIDEDEC